MKKLACMMGLICAAALPWSVSAQTTDAPAAASASAANPQGQSVKTVVASGMGRTETEATKEALRNAVQQAIGAFVTAEALVKDDNVVRDQVLSYSDGYVQKYDTVGQAKTEENGLIRVTISAQVVQQKLVEKLQAAKVTVSAVDGKTLFATTVTNQAESAEAMFKDELENIPNALMKPEVVEKPVYDAKDKKLKVTVNVSVDSTAYDNFVARFEKKLEMIHAESMSWTSARVEYNNWGACTDWKEKESEEKKSAKTIGSIHFPMGPGASCPWDPKDNDDRHAKTIFICERANRDFSSFQWKTFTVKKEVVEQIRSAVAKPLTLRVEVKDASGKTMDFGSIPIKFYGPVLYKKGVAIYPYYSHEFWVASMSVGAVSDYTWYCNSNHGEQTVQLEIPFNLSENDLKDIAKIECSVENGAVGTNRRN